MRRFRFPLRPVAILRAHRDLQARQALGVAMGTLATAEAALAAARERGRALERAIAAARGTSFRPDIQRAYLQDYRRERTTELDAEKQVLVARAEVGRRRAACVEAHRQLKIVGRLEERARAVHRADVLRAEQAEIDDRASFAAASRKPQSSP